MFDDLDVLGSVRTARAEHLLGEFEAVLELFCSS
jgi:hypothetical protein